MYQHAAQRLRNGYEKVNDDQLCIVYVAQCIENSPEHDIAQKSTAARNIKVDLLIMLSRNVTFTDKLFA
jgi:hypothetical protein